MTYLGCRAHGCRRFNCGDCAAVGRRPRVPVVTLTVTSSTPLEELAREVGERIDRVFRLARP